VLLWVCLALVDVAGYIATVPPIQALVDHLFLNAHGKFSVLARLSSLHSYRWR
jgi:hypothetical protein